MDFLLVDNSWLLRNRPWLFKRGTKPYSIGSSGVQAIHMQLGRTLNLQLAGSAPGPVTIKASDPALTIIGPDQNQRISLSSNSAITARVKVIDQAGRSISEDLWVTFGVVEKHPGMEVDLVADLLASDDPVRIHAMHRFLNNNDDNLFNENWQGNIDKWGERACGTVAKSGGQALWLNDPEAHSFRAYHIPLKVPPGKPSTRVRSRDKVKFDKKTIDKGRLAILAWLVKNRKPVLVGVLYGPTPGGFLDTGKYGTIQRGGRFGHTVMIVGSDKTAENFLYIDPWHGGSQFVYGGGITAASKFTHSCSMGILSLDNSDPIRGPILKQTIGSEGTFSRRSNDVLEVISGP